MKKINEEFLKFMKEETKKKSLYYFCGEENKFISIKELYDTLKEYQDEFYSLYKNNDKDNEDSIYFSYDNDNYECTMMFGLDVMYSLKRTSKKALFDINDVKLNKTNNEELSNRLISMKMIISDLMSMGVKESTIKEQTNIYIKRLKKVK